MATVYSTVKVHFNFDFTVLNSKSFFVLSLRIGNILRKLLLHAKQFGTLNQLQKTSHSISTNLECSFINSSCEFLPSVRQLSCIKYGNKTLRLMSQDIVLSVYNILAIGSFHLSELPRGVIPSHSSCSSRVDHPLYTAAHIRNLTQKITSHLPISTFIMSSQYIFSFPLYFL